MDSNKLRGIYSPLSSVNIAKPLKLQSPDL